jgi:hypothetical protein
MNKIVDENQKRGHIFGMTLNEAKTAYIEAQKNYRAIIANYDRSNPGHREARFRAYDELKAAQIDLADVAVEKLEDETGENLGKQLHIVVSDAVARSESCEEVFLKLA